MQEQNYDLIAFDNYKCTFCVTEELQRENAVIHPLLGYVHYAPLE